MLDPLVKTEYGVVEGKILELKDGRLVNVFLGIPYASPPIGQLRFKVKKYFQNFENITRSLKD
jgi:carboxylesterase type B